MRRQGLVQIVLVGVLVFGLQICGSQAWADDTAQLKQQVQDLQDRVNQLESELGNRQQAASATAMPAYSQWVDPLTQMMLIRDQMNRNMRQAFADTGEFSPRMDMKKTDKQYIITMDIPGMDKDKINVENKQGMLIISGERRSETEDDKNNQFYHQERSFGTFMQAIPLPEDARGDRIEARYKNGVLTVTVARVKKEEPRPESQKITVQ